MADQIRITPEQMITRAGEYKTQADVVEGVIKKMDTLLAALREEWEGESSEAYEERYLKLRPHFVTAYDLITEISDKLKTVANRSEQTDKEIADQFRG